MQSMQDRTLLRELEWLHFVSDVTSEIRQSTIYYAGLLGRWDKRIIDQESDVPSIIVFHTFYKLRELRTLYFYFCNFIKKQENKLKGFLQRILQESMKKKDLKRQTWSMRRKSHQPSDPASCI